MSAGKFSLPGHPIKLSRSALERKAFLFPFETYTRALMCYSGLCLFSTLLLAQEDPGLKILVFLFDLSHSGKIRAKAGFSRKKGP